MISSLQPYSPSVASGSSSDTRSTTIVSLPRKGRSKSPIRSSWLLHIGFLFIGIFLGIQIFVLVPLLTKGPTTSDAAVVLGAHGSHLSSSIAKYYGPEAKLKEDGNYHTAFDIVTFVHHNDLSVFIDYGLESWHKYFCHINTRIFIVCTSEAEKKLSQFQRFNTSTKQQHKNGNNKTYHETDFAQLSVWNRVVLINQVIYPFNLELVGKHNWENKHTWIYQQLLKLYSYEVLSTHPISSFLSSSEERYSSSVQKPLNRRFLILDSDTVAIRPYTFVSKDDGKPIYTISSISSGAFENDCTLSQNLLKEIFFDGSVSPVFSQNNDSNNGERFTAISHHMMFDGILLTDMIHTISKLHNKPAWQVLANLKNGVLSEWELYMAWIMKYDRTNLYLSQTPYMNAGRINPEFVSWIHDHRDITYLTRHDDYKSNQLCCINSQWPTMVSTQNDEDGGDLKCGCCNRHKCQPPKLTCDLLGLQGCHQNSSTGLIFFTEEASAASLGSDNKNHQESMNKNSLTERTTAKQVMLNSDFKEKKLPRKAFLKTDMTKSQILDKISQKLKMDH